MADVTFNHVSKRYGPVSVIEDLNLEIRDHEFMVLVGPSGCGKSTALRMIAGLEDISDGTISIGGRVVNNLAPKDRDIAMVFQSYALYPHMTVRENLEFGLKMRGIKRNDMRRRVDNAAGILDIAHLLKRKPKELSGGQRQRVAVGRAIVREPAVFLFDEPLSNLDAKLRVQTRAEITRLQQSLGTTSVYVTHDQVEAMTMGQRITVLRDGKVQQVGTPKEVYDQPANVFVAQFIGTPPMNLLLNRERAVIVGIRPEHIHRKDGGIAAKVDVVEPIGHESIVYLTAGDQKLVAIFDPEETPRAGETIGIAIEREKVHVFDATTELALDAARHQAGDVIPLQQ